MTRQLVSFALALSCACGVDALTSPICCAAEPRSGLRGWVSSLRTLMTTAHCGNACANWAGLKARTSSLKLATRKATWTGFLR